MNQNARPPARTEFEGAATQKALDGKGTETEQSVIYGVAAELSGRVFGCSELCCA